MNTNPMTAKEYLARAYHIDQRVNAKLAIVDSLKLQATGTSVQISDMPSSDTPNPHRLEATIVKLVDMQREVDAEIDLLVDTKREIMRAISAVADANQRLLLEKRYLLFQAWDTIADEMGCTIQHVHRLHTAALEIVPLMSAQ